MPGARSLQWLSTRNLNRHKLTVLSSPESSHSANSQFGTVPLPARNAHFSSCPRQSAGNALVASRTSASATPFKLQPRIGTATVLPEQRSTINQRQLIRVTISDVNKNLRCSFDARRLLEYEPGDFVQHSEATRLWFRHALLAANSGESFIT